MTKHEESTNYSTPEKSKVFSRMILFMFSMMGREINPQIAAAWGKYLNDRGWSIEDVQFACDKAVNDSKVDPYRFTIAMFLSYIKPLQMLPEEEAIPEWERVLNFVRAGGSTKGIPAEWPLRTIRAVTSVGGLPRIGNSPEKDLGYIQAQFLKAYKTYASIYESEARQELLEERKNKAISGAINKLCETTDMKNGQTNEDRRSTQPTEEIQPT